eukprot:10110574-Lingulodinium_polyedra.AAC.1
MQAKHQELAELVKAEQAVTPPLIMSAAALATPYLDLFERLVQDSGFRGSQRIGALRAAALATPLPTNAKQRELLEACT